MTNDSGILSPVFVLGSRPAHWLLLAVFTVSMLGYQLGTRGLNEPDEGRYANIAVEVLEFDHPWWEPQLADVGHYDKPPLTYWISSLGYRVLGVNAWGARLPSLLGAFMTLVGVGWLASRRYGPSVAWLAVLMASTLLQIWVWAHILSSDMLLTGWCALAIGAWAETRRRGGSLPWWGLQVLFWSLAGWTKATPALVPLLGLAVYVFTLGDAEDRRALKLPILLPLVFLLSIPWYVIILTQHPELKNFFLHRELVARITGHIEGRSGPIYYYIPLCLLGWLPWWPLALAAYLRRRAASRLPRLPWREIAGPGLCLTVVGFCFFSLIGSKHATYLLPFAPWAALEMARFLERDPALRRAAVILPVAGVSAAIYLVALNLIPSRESRWGMHSSLRDVAQTLRAHHAARIYCDHFWPSLEVYFGEEVHFNEGAPEEVFDQADEPDEHFGFSNPGLLPGGWFVHFRKERNSSLSRWLNDPRLPKIQVGDFVIGPMTPSPDTISMEQSSPLSSHPLPTNGPSLSKLRSYEDKASGTPIN